MTTDISCSKKSAFDLLGEDGNKSAGANGDFADFNPRVDEKTGK